MAILRRRRRQPEKALVSATEVFSDAIEEMTKASRELRVALKHAVGTTVHSEPRVAVAEQVVRLIRDSAAILDVVRDVVVQLGADAGLVSVLTATECYNLCRYFITSPEIAECVPETHSYCRYTITMGEPLAISNAARNALVYDAEYASTIKGYLGAPVSVAGFNIGAICVLTLEPHEWTSHHKAAILHSSHIVSDALNKVLQLHQPDKNTPPS